VRAKSRSSLNRTSAPTWKSMARNPPPDRASPIGRARWRASCRPSYTVIRASLDR
jgi:hypothetical protein